MPNQVSYDSRRRAARTDVTATARKHAKPAMRPRETVHPEHLVQPRAARHEDQLDERQIRAEERGDLAGRGQDGRGAGQMIGASVTDPHRDDERAVGDEERHDVGGADRPEPWKRDAGGSRGALHGWVPGAVATPPRGRLMPASWETRLKQA